MNSHEFLVNLVKRCRSGSELWLSYTLLMKDAATEPEFETKFRDLFLETVKTISTSSSTTDIIPCINFLSLCYRELDNVHIRTIVLPFLSLPLWLEVTKNRVEKELSSSSKQLKKQWETVKRKFLQTEDIPERKSILCLIKSLLKPEQTEEIVLLLMYFFIELLSQIPTRRFLHLLILDYHLIPQLRLSKFYSSSQNFKKLLLMFEEIEKHAVNDLTGEPIPKAESEQMHCQRIQSLQRVVFKMFPEKLSDLALENISNAEKKDALLKYFSVLTDTELITLSISLGIIDAEKDKNIQRPLLQEILLYFHEKTKTASENALSSSLLPTEKTLWTEENDPLPSVNMQFLSLEDYFLRHYKLYTSESNSGVKEDIEFTLKRFKNGSARMALPIKDVKIIKVSQPALGETKPAEVICEFHLSLNDCHQLKWKSEWEELRQFDILFLISLNQQSDQHKSPVSLLRGCEIIEIIDENGFVIRDQDHTSKEKLPSGQIRTFKVKLDSAQYSNDLLSVGGSEEKIKEIYSSLSVVIRRKAEENSFKSVLDALRSFIAKPESVGIPFWLSDMLLGYGQEQQQNEEENGDDSAGESKSDLTIDFLDTFISEQHLKQSFPGRQVIISRKPEVENNQCNWCINFPKSSKNPIEAIGYISSSLTALRNNVEFTPDQIEAIRDGMKEGLTMINGAPGGGKTSVAVQIIANLYHTFPNQRILIVTRSNDALNQMFDKLVTLDIDERHCLRLGHGEKRLFANKSSGKDFSRRGRVNYSLERRILLLAKVNELARSLKVQSPDSASETCESAMYFYSVHILPRWKRFTEKRQNSTAEQQELAFPFSDYFSNSNSKPEAKVDEERCWKQLSLMFEEISELRAFELLRANSDRANYLLSRQARIVALTCAHAALKRRDLLALGFRYDTVIMEESSQVIECEALIPMLLHKQEGITDESSNRGRKLIRVVLFGDHLQLGPVLRNENLKHESGLDQSMFNRFVRVGAKVHLLEAQGRCRQSLTPLFSWRYGGRITNLPIVNTGTFLLANAGLAYDCQIIDVADLDGQGETSPAPHVHQNLAEAEYVVHFYMYLRLLGYPSASIALLTAYKGQQDLLHEVVKHRCCSTYEQKQLIGEAQISTVDSFQGRQADIVLLSLVRTKNPGHLRDVRRMVVGFSRERLGLYVFCRKSLLLKSCPELTPALQILNSRPDTLQLVENEPYPTNRKIDEKVNSFTVKNVDEMAKIVGLAFASRLREFKQHQQLQLQLQLQQKQQKQLQQQANFTQEQQTIPMDFTPIHIPPQKQKDQEMDK